jgi:hypothetical protein
MNGEKMKKKEIVFAIALYGIAVSLLALTVFFPAYNIVQSSAGQKGQGNAIGISTLIEYNAKNQVVGYWDPTNRMTNIGRNFTLIKWFGRYHYHSSASQIENVTVNEYMANVTYCVFGYYASGALSNSSIALPNYGYSGSASGVISVPAANFTVSLVSASKVYMNLTAYWYPGVNGYLNCTGDQWSSSTSTSLFSYCTYSTISFGASDHFVYLDQWCESTL